MDEENNLDEPSQEIVQMMVDELRHIEKSELFRRNMKRTIRKAKIQKGEPIRVDDTDLETAYHSAMINMQLNTDAMSYDHFKRIYDEVVQQLKPVEAIELV